jgi:hypothetical protein
MKNYQIDFVTKGGRTQAMKQVQAKSKRAALISVLDIPEEWNITRVKYCGIDSLKAKYNDSEVLIYCFNN